MNFGIIHLARQDLLWLLPFFCVALFFIIKDFFYIKSAVGKILRPSNQGIMFPGFSLTRRGIKAILWSLALCSLFLACLRPQWGKKDEAIMQEGRDLLILFDISRSMQAEDMRPSRLEFAKLKVRDLIERLPCERVGLILFSGSACVQCPFTADYHAFKTFLDDISVESIASGTTALDVALQKALDLLSKSPARKNKLLLFVTDGEDFSLNLESIKGKAKELGVKIFALGVGTNEGAPIPKTNDQGQRDGYEVDEKGGVALSKLNEAMLAKLCSDLGGQYIRLVYNNSDIEALVGHVAQFDKEQFEEQQFSVYEDKYPWFLVMAWLFLALEWII